MSAMNLIPELPEAPPEFTSVEADAAAELIRLALAEDLGDAGDRTGEALIEQDAGGRIEIRSRDDGIVCGLPVVTQIFETLDTRVTLTLHVRDGQRIEEPGFVPAIAVGPGAPGEAILGHGQNILRQILHCAAPERGLQRGSRHISP